MLDYHSTGFALMNARDEAANPRHERNSSNERQYSPDASTPPRCGGALEGLEQRQQTRGSPEAR